MDNLMRVLKTTLFIAMLALSIKNIFSMEEYIFDKSSQKRDCSSFYPPGSDLNSCAYHIISHYRQTEYKESDPLGDFVLLESFRLRFKEKKDLALGKNELQDYLRFALLDEDNKNYALGLMNLPTPIPPVYAEEDVDFDRDKYEQQVIKSDISDEIKNELLQERNLLTLSGKRNPLLKENLVKMFIQVINEERVKTNDSCIDMEPKHGIEPKWAKKNDLIKFYSFHTATKIFSKLLISLAVGETNQFMYVGTEPLLREWIFRQDNRSIDFESIFRKSYQLNCGDVAKTMMAILNTLSEHYRYPNRQLLLQTVKLSPIINHLGNNADVFGPWYHFFGLMIYGYHKNKNLGELHAFIERGTALFYDEQDEKQENYMRAALYVGDKLSKIISTKKYEQIEMNSEYTRRSFYLDLSEDFTKQIEKRYK
jgi:hypothetical protein